MPISSKVLSQPSLLAAIPRPLQPIKGFPTAYRQTSTLKHVEAGGDNYITLQNTNSSLSTREDKTSGGDVCSVCRGTGALLASHLLPLEGGREHHTPNRSLKVLCLLLSIRQSKLELNGGFHDYIFFCFMFVLFL